MSEDVEDGLKKAHSTIKLWFRAYVWVFICPSDLWWSYRSVFAPRIRRIHVRWFWRLYGTRAAHLPQSKHVSTQQYLLAACRLSYDVIRSEQADLLPPSRMRLSVARIQITPFGPFGSSDHWHLSDAHVFNAKCCTVFIPYCGRGCALHTLKVFNSMVSACLRAWIFICLCSSIHMFMRHPRSSYIASCTCPLYHPVFDNCSTPGRSIYDKYTG